MERRIDFNHDSASATLTLWEGSRFATLNNLESTDRMKGHATALLDDIVRFADASGLTVYLQSMAYGEEPRIPDLQLVSLYERFGFVAQDDFTTPFMTRNPQ